MVSIAEIGNIYDLRGLSTDSKPTKFTKDGEERPFSNGSTFFEMDTKKLFMFDGETKQWREI